MDPLTVTPDEADAAEALIAKTSDRDRAVFALVDAMNSTHPGWMSDLLVRVAERIIDSILGSPPGSVAVLSVESYQDSCQLAHAVRCGGSTPCPSCGHQAPEYDGAPTEGDVREATRVIRRMLGLGEKQ